jgi:serine/threonine protein kinase
MSDSTLPFPTPERPAGSTTISAGQTTMLQAETSAPPMDRALVNLIENYHSVSREQAIYYPVCYRFDRLLGEGHQGKVYVGLRQGARGCTTRHAIKIFNPAVYHSTQQYWTDMGRIASQLSTLQTLRSPNLVSMDTYDEVNGIGYVQMEVINGADVREIIAGSYYHEVSNLFEPEAWREVSRAIFHEEPGRPRSIQPGIAVYIMRMLLKGLENLHEAGFLHSDIKPSNIMVDRFGHVKIIDYGRAVKPREKVNLLLGSPLYMAPEIHLREPGVEQSDLYSVGLVGLEMMRGEPLINAAGLSESDLLAGKLSLPGRLESLLPAHVRDNRDLVRVLQRFIHPDPRERFPDARSAETEDEGLRRVHQQLVQIGQDADYARLMGDFLSRLTLAREAARCS